MSNWPEGALEPSNDDESTSEEVEKFPETIAVPGVEEHKPEFARNLKRLESVARGLEIARAPERRSKTPDPELCVLETGKIGRAAMVEMVPLWKLMELLDKHGPLTKAGKTIPKEPQTLDNLSV